MASYDSTLPYPNSSGKTFADNILDLETYFVLNNEGKITAPVLQNIVKNILYTIPLSGSTNFNISTLTSNDILSYNGTKWINSKNIVTSGLTLNAGVTVYSIQNTTGVTNPSTTLLTESAIDDIIGGVDELSELTDVNIPSPTQDDFLYYSGGTWINLPYTGYSMYGGDINGNVNIIGDLNVTGNTIYFNTQSLTTTSNSFILNSGETGPGVTSPFVMIAIDRGPLDNPFSLIYMESDKQLRIGIDSPYVVSTREDIPTEGAFGYWSGSTGQFLTDSNFTINTIYTKSEVYNTGETYSISEINNLLDSYYTTSESDSNFLSANTSFYTQSEANSNFLSANTSFYTQSEVNSNFLSANTSFYTQSEVNSNFLSANTSFYTQSEVNSNFLSANTSFYTQSEVNSNFLSANTSLDFISKTGDTMSGDLNIQTNLFITGSTKLNTLTLQSGATVYNISTNSSLTNDDNTLQTSKSIKDYVDNIISTPYSATTATTDLVIDLDNTYSKTYYLSASTINISGGTLPNVDRSTTVTFEFNNVYESVVTLNWWTNFISTNWVGTQLTSINSGETYVISIMNFGQNSSIVNYIKKGI